MIAKFWDHIYEKSMKLNKRLVIIYGCSSKIHISARGTPRGLRISPTPAPADDNLAHRECDLAAFPGKMFSFQNSGCAFPTSLKTSSRG